MTKITLPTPETLTISGQAAEKLIKTGDGDAALLYLHILATRGGKTVSETAAELRKSEDSVSRAMRTLAKLGLVLMEDEPEFVAPEPALNIPVENQTAKRAKPSLTKNSAFTHVVRETEKVMGKTLSSDDLERLYGIYESLKLPPDVIIQLVHHCAAETRRERGENKRPTMRFIEKAAYIWERQGVFSLDRAESYIKEREERRSATGEIKEILKIQDRDLSQTETQYIETWLSLGFQTDSIAIAYDRTVLNTGKLAWGYMDKIINNWHSQNLHTANEILSRDVKYTAKTAQPATKTTAAPNAGEIERMNKLLERMKQGG